MTVFLYSESQPTFLLFHDLLVYRAGPIAQSSQSLVGQCKV